MEVDQTLQYAVTLPSTPFP